MDIRVERVNKAKATKLLNFNTENRSLRPGIVEQYAADMRAGKWTQCMSPIVFYKDGRLSDGQHRLWAVIESDTSHEFIIVRGATKEDGLNIDTGFGRTLVDNGRISGMDTELSFTVIATARAIHTGQPAVDRMSNSAKLEIVQQHRAAAEWAASAVPKKANGVRNSVTLAAVSRAWYVESDVARLDEFCKVIGTGYSNGEDDSAAVTMRTYLLTYKGACSSGVWRDSFLKMQNAISYFMRRKKLTVIRGVQDEAYPLGKARK